MPPGIGWPVVISLVVSALGAAAAWGAFSNRVTNLETDAKEQRELVQQHDRSISGISSTLQSIDQQLGRMDRKLDRIERREQ